MDNEFLLKKLGNLPEHLQKQVVDFVDFLIINAAKQMEAGKGFSPKFGSGKGMFVMHDDFDKPLEGFV